jgi:transposase-like protein
LVGRGLDLRQPHLNIIDGGKGLLAALRKYCGDAGLVQRCQLHKRRNVCGHFADEDQPRWDRKLANAYDLREYKEAKAALLRIQRELMEINPSAARSLEEGMEETLTLHRLRVPMELWKTLRSTNPIRIGILHRSRRVPKREAMAARPSDRTMGRFGIDRCGKTVPAHRWLSRPPRVDLFARRSTHWYRSQAQGRLRLIIGFGESSEF